MLQYVLGLFLCFASLFDPFGVRSGEVDVQSNFVGIDCVLSPLYVAKGFQNVG